MSRAPIIISNGGVLDLLTEGLVEGLVDEKVEPKAIEDLKNHAKKIIRKNVKDEIEKQDTEIVVIKSRGKNAPCLFWRKKNIEIDSDYNKTLKNYEYTDFEREEMYGIEGPSINAILDDTE